MNVLPTVPVLETKPPEATAFSRDPRKKEKRKSKRDPISGSVTVLWGTTAQEERISRANMIDLSSHGAKFRTSERIPAGSWLMFNYHQLGASGRGTVRYCQLVKSCYQIGVEFSGGTGWNPASNRFTAELRNLSIAVDCLQTTDSHDA
jgi:hypothetical protein